MTSSLYCFPSYQEFYSRAIAIGFKTEDESKAFHSAFESWKNEVIGAESGMLSNE